MISMPILSLEYGSKYKHAELVKLIRPALLGCYWSLWHETRHFGYTNFINDALRKKLPLAESRPYHFVFHRQELRYVKRVR